MRQRGLTPRQLQCRGYKLPSRLVRYQTLEILKKYRGAKILLYVAGVVHEDFQKLPYDLVVVTNYEFRNQFPHLDGKVLKLSLENRLALRLMIKARLKIDCFVGINDGENEGGNIGGCINNHEDMLLTAVESPELNHIEWLINGGAECLASYSVDSPNDIPEEHLNFIKSLPTHYVTDTHVFVHAGLNFSQNNPIEDTGRTYKLWNRINMKADPNKIGGRIVVSGHTVRNLSQIRLTLNRNPIQLDNGCYLGKEYFDRGNLLALELTNGELFVQENCE